MSKRDRKNQSRQKQLLKHQQHVQSTKLFAGQNGAPRIVAIVPLCVDVQSTAVVRHLNASLGIEDAVPVQGSCTVRIDRFKQSVQYVLCSRSIFETLDACKAADYVLFVLSALEEVDAIGETLLKAAGSQGISNMVTVVSGLNDRKSGREQSQTLSSLKAFISHYFPEQDKVHSLDAPQECSNVLRSICTSVPRGIGWRDERSWMIVDQVEWATDETSDSCPVMLTGFVRGAKLSANRLLHVGDWGFFQIDQILEAPLSSHRKRKADEMALDSSGNGVLQRPDHRQEDLLEVAPEEVPMEDFEGSARSEMTTDRKGVLIDDEYKYSDEGEPFSEAPRKLPRGTSSYQAAWYLDGMSDSGSDWEDQQDESRDFEMEVEEVPGISDEMPEHAAQGDATEANVSTYPESEMFLDQTPQDEAEEIAKYRSARRKEADEDREFPDEIELHPKVLARERLARYRGLKSLRSSHWVTEPDKPHAPEQWNRLLQMSHYSGARKKATSNEADTGVEIGTRVQVRVCNVPVMHKDSSYPLVPLVAFALHQHEQKHTVMNFRITLDPECEGSVKSKEELFLQCGPRRLVVNPLFSDPGHTPNDVHKYNRHLHPGRTAIATVIAPLTWGQVPALFFRQSESPQSTSTESSPLPLKFVGTGTALPPSSSRVIAKRVILTGHPYKIHKRLVTVRYMFFNAEDVRWFRALRLWTRYGRSGFIKESLGTHGYFKATFDGHINPQDAIAVSLYKRVWPRIARPWIARPEGGVVGEVEMAG